MPANHESNVSERRYITMNFVPSDRPRSAHYLVIDYDSRTDIMTVDDLPYTIATRPVLGVLVQHHIDDASGLFGSRVVYAVYAHDYHELVDLQDESEFDPGTQLIGVYNEGEKPEAETVELYLQMVQDDVRDRLRKINASTSRAR